jgi:hypothetical protein
MNQRKISFFLDLNQPFGVELVVVVVVVLVL